MSLQTTISFKDNNSICFQNDLGITDIGDPFMLKISDNEYYMYCTSAADGFYCWRSEDMVHWGNKTKCYTKEDMSWGKDSFWAPEVVIYNDQYYMFYTARNQSGTLQIGLAIAENPAGPFIDIKNAPLFDFGYAAIDANVLIDDDGSKYLYFSRDCSENIIDGKHVSQTYGIQLADDMKSVVGEAVLLTTPEQPWELVSGDYLWNEGPEVIKHKDTYYLSYSANYYASTDYSLGYAISKSPLGPFVKSEENPILTSKGLKDVSGTGHHSFVKLPDDSELWIAYHSHTDVLHPSGDRKVNIARAGFTEDGKLYINGPLTVSQPLPSGITATNITNLFTAFINKSEHPELTNRRIQIHRNQDLSVNIPADKRGKVTVSLLENSADNKKEIPDINALAIYTLQNEICNIASLQLIINDEFCSQDYIITGEKKSPIVLFFDSISAYKIDVVITILEEEKGLSLSEIEIFSKK